MQAMIKQLTTNIILASNVNPLLYWTDSYKLSHILFEIYGVSEIYSNFTPRFDHYLKQRLGRFMMGNML